MASRKTPTLRLAALAGSLVLAGFTTAAADRTPQRQSPPRQQAPPPAVSFLTQVTLVEVDAIVLDRDGRVVPDLRADEFEILEDGRRQTIESFRLVDVPVTPANPVPAGPGDAGAPPISDTASNATPPDGRLYLIVLDDLHVSPARTTAARRIARDFIERTLGPDDIAAVLATSGNRRAMQDFTTDKARLFRAVDTMVGQKVISPWLAAIGGNMTPDEVGPSDRAALLRISQARSAIDTMSRLAAIAGTIRNRRKAMVVVGEGIDYILGMPTPATDMPTSTEDQPAPRSGGIVNEGTAPRELRDNINAFINVANRANVSVYALDPRIFTHGADEYMDITAGVSSMLSTPDRLSALQDALLASQDNLRTIAAGTGGFAATGSLENVTGAFERIRVESSVYYMLAYTPTNDQPDGRFRAISVRVSRPGVTVRARRGYTAPKANAPVPSMPAVEVPTDTSPELREALAATLPVSGLTLGTAAAAVRGEGREATVIVLVQLLGSELLFTRAEDRYTDTVEMAVAAVDREGRTRAGEHLNLRMPLSAPNHDLVTRAGLVVPVRLALPPGAYQLRVGGRDQGSLRLGSVHHDVEVPDFGASPLGVSGVVLTAVEAGAVPMPRQDDLLDRMLPGTPITARTFARDDRITAAVELYDAQPESVRGLDLLVTVRTREGRVLSSRTESRQAADLRDGRSIARFTVGLQPFDAGDYVLTIEARSTHQPDRVERREVPFRVR